MSGNSGTIYFHDPTDINLSTSRIFWQGHLLGSKEAKQCISITTAFKLPFSEIELLDPNTLRLSLHAPGQSTFRDTCYE